MAKPPESRFLLDTDEVTLLRANKLQSKYLLDPFDSILLALASTTDRVILVSRDAGFLKVARKIVEARTPEEAIKLLPMGSE